MGSKFLKEGLVYGIGGALSRFTGVFVTPIYTRFLTSEEYGILDLGTTISSLVLVFVEMQMVTGLMRHYYDAKKEGNRDALYGSVALYFLLANVLIWLVVWGGSSHLVDLLPGFSIWTLIPVVIIVLPNLFVQLALGVLRLEHRPRKFLFFSIGQTWTSAFLGILSVVFFDFGPEGILWSFAIAKFIYSVPALIYCYKTMHFTPKFDYFKRVFTYSAPIVPAVIGKWVNSYMSRFFITAAISLSALGVFSLSYKVASIFLLISVGFRMAWNPFALKQFTKQGTEPVFAKAYSLYFFGAFAFLVIIGAFSPWLVKLFATSEYYEAMNYVTILSAAFLWDGAINILAIGNNWEKKTYYNMFGSILAGALNLLLLWLFIEKWGLAVAAYAFLVSTIIQALIIYGIAQRVHYIPHRKSMMISSVLITLSFSIESYVVSNLVSNYMLATGILFSSGFLLILFLWRIILSHEERIALKSLINSARGSILNRLRPSSKSN